jgi:hypothetical protein
LAELDETSPPPQAPSIAARVSNDVTRANRFSKKIISDHQKGFNEWLTPATIGQLTRSKPAPVSGRKPSLTSQDKPPPPAPLMPQLRADREPCCHIDRLLLGRQFP